MATKNTVLRRLLLAGSCAFFSLAAVATPVTTERLVNADAEIDNWLTHGRTYHETRFSPLKEINDSNVDQLGLAWSYEFPDNRGLQATPIVVDGVMYSSGSWSRVYAHNAATGELLWMFDPQVQREHLVRACCGPMNRGVAVWQDKVFVGTLDGYLVAINRDSGEQVWRTLTIDPSKDYSITGAPRVVKGRVLIGNGGAEYGVRGYLSAYDAETGEMAWRFYTVPGNPADGFENETLAKAAETWSGEWWKLGGGGTVWDSFSYDPALNLVYIGVGNGSPWNHQIRSEGKGDNLFLSSIVAVDADSGEYAWHYQTTPGESWDFTATQQIILADIEWQGEQRKVLMQAPKNGFFFIIDRVTGEFLSAEPFTKVVWAEGYDDNGRPIESEGVRFQQKKALMMPSAIGGHNWHPMAYSEDTGLVYIPVIKGMMEYQQPENFDPKPHHQNFGVNLPGDMLVDPYFMQILKDKITRGELQAWDPEKQQPVWSYKHKRTWNGGVLATAGNLVFQGTADHRLLAFDARNGDLLWDYDTRLAIMAAPVTYRVDGVQYLAVLAKWGGAFPMMVGLSPYPGLENGRLLVFRLGGTAELPDLPPAKQPIKPPLPMTITDEASLKAGERLYEAYCTACHGKDVVSGGTVPDLRYRVSQYPFDAFKLFVLDGVLAEKGMVSFRDVLDEGSAEQVYNYILMKANSEYKLQQEINSLPMRLRLWVYDKLVSFMVLAVEGSVGFYLSMALVNLLFIWVLWRVIRRIRRR